MIIKRPLKFEMPNVKRCKLEEPEATAYEFSANPKKRKTNGYSSVGNGEGEDFSSGSGSSYNDELSWPTKEVQSNLERLINQRALNRSSGKFRRSSRGRIQMLPSRFNDSVIDVYKNRETNFDEEEGYEVLVEDDIEGIEKLGFVKKSQEDIYRHKNSKKFQYYGKEEQEEDDVDCIGYNHFDHRNYTTLNKSGKYSDGFSLGGMEKISKANGAKKKEIYKPQDFALGDIVWAKCGKSYPAWPAVVIDPILQAPKSVLRCCVPGAICVMFYGFSKNGTQRVNLLIVKLSVFFRSTTNLFRVEFK